MDGGYIYGGYASLSTAAVIISCILVLLSFVIAEPMNLVVLLRGLRDGDSVSGERKREYWMFYRILLYSIWFMEGLWLCVWTPFYMAEILFQYYNDSVSKACFIIERGIFVLTLSITLLNLLIFWFATVCEKCQVVFETVRGLLHGAVISCWLAAITYTIFQLIVIGSVQENQFYYSGQNYNTWSCVFALFELCVCFLVVCAAILAVRYAQHSTNLQRVQVRQNFQNPYSIQNNRLDESGTSGDLKGGPKVAAALFIESRTIAILLATWLVLVLPYDILQVVFEFGGCSLNTYVNVTTVLQALTATHTIVCMSTVIVAQNRKVDYY